MTNNSNDSCRYTSFLCGKGTFYISVAVLVLFIVNCVIIGLNRHTQNEIVSMQQDMAEKGQTIQKNQVFGNIFQGLVQSLANAAINKKDEQIKKMLTDNGLKIQVKGKEDAAAPKAPAAPAPAPKPAE
jgi:hypothetical protein